ncbi:hypothetical protein ABMA27_005846 [Loxostege sticticalis]|uniref:Uncharacterized protein n=1 Tax=Loxostege sticticalis TaxID=481309 RepID=A0ABR3HGP0_LOXSC
MKELLFMLGVVTHVSSYCPEMHPMGLCSFRVVCRGDIRDVSLPYKCQGSTNIPVTVNLTLTEANERFDDKIIDVEFFSSVTSFRVSGNWPKTALSILEYMPRLQKLYLDNNNIKHIISNDEGGPFFHLNRLEVLDLSQNSLTDIDIFSFENYPNKMKKLSLAYNAIDKILGDVFGELTSLVELDLSHNLISDLTEEPFSNMTKLEVLKLNDNRIKNLNGAVNNLQNLKHLFLKGNHIQNIDDQSLKIIYDLETFDISWNQLDSLTSVVFSRHWNHFASNSVCKIKLSGNHITSVPNATSKEILERFTRSIRKNFNPVDVLTELDLSKNEISNIEYNAFQSLVKLSSLDLSCNKLVGFVVNPHDLEHLKYLNLSTNYITNLYFESFLSMSNLQNLDLSHNYLDVIPDKTFMNNYNLKYVNMTHNEIKELENLRIKTFHPDGGVLDLSNNGLFKFNLLFGEGLRLNILLLNSNNISDASLVKLHYQTELKTLDMSWNLIEELDENSLRLPVTLSTLNLNYNKIQKIAPSSFHQLGHLKMLRLAHNNLSEIEYGAFQGLTSLMHLDLSFNNIRYLDSKVLMDLKSLAILSLRFNGLYSLDYNGWLGHKIDLKVYMEGNSFSCEWLGHALTDFNNGYSRMRPTVLMRTMSGHSLEGIPCIKKESEMELARLTSASDSVMADERLLVLTQKILEAIKEQNHFMKRFIWGAHVQHLVETEKLKR